MKGKIFEQLTGLSERERSILTMFVCFFLFFTVGVIYFAMNSYVEDKKAAIAEQEGMLLKMVSLKNIYQRAQKQQEDMKASISRNVVNLNSDISTVKDSIGIDISTLRELTPRKKGDISVERTEVGMRNVSMEDLLGFLYGIENRSRYVFIDAINVRKRFDRQNYDISVTVATLKKELGDE
jgi:nucleoside permease NupC